MNDETGFGIAFALGQTALGILADRVNVRWYYPLLLAIWSLMGFATGMMYTFTGLLICRVLLGLFEGGNWRCGIKTIQNLLPPAERALGSGILQSGGAIGAMLTPLVVGLLLSDELGSWRRPFLVIGAAGLSWVVLWLASVRSADLRLRADDVNPARKVSHGLQEDESSFDVGLAFIGWLPLLSWVVLWRFGPDSRYSS